MLVTVAAIFAPWIAPDDPNAQNLSDTNAGISASHWLGTDDLGRDVLSRLIYGARISMQITFETVAIALVLALVIGLVAGFRGGRIDYLLMRGADAGLAFPPLILALAVVAVLGSGVNDVALAFALVFAPGFARFIRGQTLAIKEEAFVEASTSIGTPPTRIVAGADPPQRDDRPRRRHRHRPRGRPPDVLGAQLPRPGPPTAGSQLGLHARRGVQHGTVHPPLVPRPLRPRHRPDGSRLQHSRGRPARHRERGHDQGAHRHARTQRGLTAVSRPAEAGPSCRLAGARVTGPP